MTSLAISRAMRPFSVRATLVVVALLGLSACSSDTTSTQSTGQGEGGGLEACLTGASSGIDCYAKADVRRVSNSQQMTGASGDKTEVQIGSVALGSTIDIDFRIANNAAKVTAAGLRIDDIRLEYTLKSPQETADNPALTCWDATGKVSCADQKGKWQKVVPPGTEDTAKGLFLNENFKIRYRQYDALPRSARVCLRMGGDKVFANKDMCFAVVTTAGKPKLQVQPNQVDFAYVQVGSTQDNTRAISLINAGQSTLYINKFEINLDPAFSLQLGDKTYKAGSPVLLDPPLVIEPQKTAGATVVFQPTDDKKRSGDIKIFSNDPSIVGGLPVLVTANSKVPCLKVDPSPVVNFGAVKLGNISKTTITLSNCGTEKLSLTNINLKQAANGPFSLDFGAAGAPTADKPWVLEMGGQAQVPATYTPPVLADAPDIGTVEFVSNASPQSVKLTGVCVQETCPEAKIAVTEGEEVVPQTVLHLKGSNSVAPGGGSISKYVWSVTKQPEGSKQSFVPGPTFPDPTFTANAAGTYEFCLDVYDDQAPPQKSCQPACVTVLVVPSEALHVELLWKTPSDPDETDKGQGVGADMDVHLANPLAQGQDLDCDGTPDPWFSQPFDVFWFNPTPKWGSAGTADDDARLDLDDTDGGGPENVNLDSPQGTGSEPFQYALGVHYWNDHGFGKSFATVRVYVLGKLAVELIDQELKPVDMWYVGKINWPNEAMGGTGPVLQQCLQTGDACLSVKDPTNPKAGKMWQASGNPCIRPCYLSPLANSNGGACGL